MRSHFSLSQSIDFISSWRQFRTRNIEITTATKKAQFNQELLLKIIILGLFLLLVASWEPLTHFLFILRLSKNNYLSFMFSPYSFPSAKVCHLFSMVYGYVNTKMTWLLEEITQNGIFIQKNGFLFGPFNTGQYLRETVRTVLSGWLCWSEYINCHIPKAKLQVRSWWEEALGVPGPRTVVLPQKPGKLRP